MHPFLFQLGPLPIPTYGVVIAITLVVGMLLVRWLARREGRDPAQTMDAIFWSIMAGLVGGRVLEAIINWERYFGTPGGLRLLVYSTGVFVGGLIAAIGFGIYWFRRIKLPVLQGLDILALVGALAEALGRWGCFFSGCCWGTPTDLPWAVTFPELARKLHAGLPAVPLHPTQIYFSLNGWVILGLLFLLYRRKRFHGQVITVFVFLYAVTRFFLEFVRGDAERGTVFGGLLTTSQFIGLGLAVAAVAGYVYLDLRHRRTGQPDWRPAAVAAPAPVPAASGGRRKASRRQR
jgi:phosphatidylglycerol:prolipoprotein diacylglycerol transferase